MSARASSWLARGVLALGLVALASSPAGAAGRLPVEVKNPRTGAPVAVEAGARALHVVFFATWCPPCIGELERLADLETRWSGRGYRLIVLAVPTRQTPDRLTKFAEDRQPPGELLFDAEGRVGEAWKVSELPTHVLLDATGAEVLRAKTLGRDFEQAVDTLLSRRGSGS